MALYTPQSVSGFNASPPPDDASATDANKVKWSTIKSKLADPLDTFAAAIDAALQTAFAAVGRTTFNLTSIINSAVAAGTTVYLYSSGHSASEFEVGMPYAGTARNLRVISTAAPGGAETFTYTLRKNNADTALTCVVSAGSSNASDTSHTVNFAAGDGFGVKLVTSAGAAAVAHSVVFEYQQSA